MAAAVTAADGTRRNVVVDVATAILTECLDALGADAAYVATADEASGALDVARVTRFADRPVRLSFATDAPYPLAHAIRTRSPLFIGSNDELCHHPGLVRVQSDDHACATLPLFDDEGSVLGALNFGYDEPHEFSREELELFSLVASHCARAVSAADELASELARRSPR